MKAILVVTSIGDGRFVEHYAKALRDCDDVEMIAIPDRKTPDSFYQACQNAAKGGFKVLCPSLSEQEEFLKRVGSVGPLIPHDSDNRRNIGFLMALEKGCDYLVSLDDDNYCLDGREFLEEHAVVCKPSANGQLACSSTRWVNICDLLTKSPDRPIYARGFPYKYRFRSEKVSFQESTGQVAANAGLWLREPDVDAVSRLAETVCVAGHNGSSWLLGSEAWTPINTQNTALRFEAVPAYYYVRMGYPVGGVRVDRYGDILSGYFLQVCAHHRGHLLRVGSPVAEHIRNTHNLFNDLANELWCMWMLEDLCDWLTEVELQGGTYCETYLSLAAALEDFAARVSGPVWNDGTRGFLFQTTACMRAWIGSCKQLGLR
jgi:hypothetical protein